MGRVGQGRAVGRDRVEYGKVGLGWFWVEFG